MTEKIKLQKHKYNIYPEITGEDLEELKNSIKDGYDVRMPIVLYEGKILDGWNRYKICDELDIIPEATMFEGDDQDALDYVIKTNKRRHLTQSQKACIAVDYLPLFEAAAKERQVRKPVNSVRELIPQQNLGKSTDHTGEMFGVTGRYISEAKRLKEEHPEEFKKIYSGDKTITEVAKEIKQTKRVEEINRIKDMIDKENLTSTGLYDVVVIDPPWDYGEVGAARGEDYNPSSVRGTTPYPSMSMNEIKNIKLPTKDDAVIFLWTTHAFLKAAFDLLDEWGLMYKATIVWDKEKIGIGRTIRLQCEFCLLAIKGNPIIEGNNTRDIIREPRREHSRKPEGFYKMVNELCVGKKLDYFAREKRDGWEVCGVETSKF